MKSYISYLYNLDLHENECNPPVRHAHKENVLYDELKDMLTEKQFDMLDELINAMIDRYSTECEIYFKKGFRFAMRLVLECFNEKDNEGENE